MDARPEFQRAPGAPPLPETPFRFICHFIARFRWWYVAMVVFETINSTCGILIPYATGQVIKAVTQAHEQSLALVDSLRGPVWLFVALSIGEVIFSRAGGRCQIILGPRQRQTVTRALYAYLQHHSHRYLSNDFAGALAHRISETSLGVSQTLWTVIFDFWPMAIVFGVSIGILGHAYRGLAALVGVWAVFFVGISFWLAMRARPYAVAASAARSETTGKVVDAVTNLTSTRLFARLGYERDYLDAQLRKELKAVRRSNGYSERVRWFQYVAAAALKVGVLYYSLQLWGRGQITVAEFVVACTTALLIINEARNLSRRFLEFFEYMGNVANGVHVIVKPHEIVDRPEAVAAVIDRGRIEFQSVTFGYVPEKPIFRDLSVVIPAGQRVGLVGFSGSGKSTFVSLILRLYDVQGGRILIDGTDIRTMTQDSLHEQLSLIPQDPNLFHRTLLENIRYGRLDASEEEVMAAARKAHAHDFVMQIKDQYGALVGERGVKLSGGQRQRVAIARVVVKNAPILILDEATSSLDSITEQAIQETLDEVMKGKTVIVVAHRLSTIAHLDRILVFDQGRIVEDGSHAQLLALQGAYHRLWSRQAGGFVLDDGAGDGRTVSLTRPVEAEEEEDAEPQAMPEEVIGHDRNPKRRPSVS
ncbi:MAG TPA: ABC transporter ATP-binding protein [Steroidobacteraceae bacterium]|nr:ABC transporter ATP-binding protein [Steroidobacteraceae bacterium]